MRTSPGWRSRCSISPTSATTPTPTPPRRCASGRVTSASPPSASGRPTSSLCVDALDGTDVGVATVVNFPSGEEPDQDVLAATRLALEDGADEIDVVLPYRRGCAATTRRRRAVLDGVRDLVSEGVDHSAGLGIVKVIIESRRAARPGGDRPGDPLRHRPRRRLRQDLDGQDAGVGDAGGGRDHPRGDRAVGHAGRVQGVRRHPHGRRRPGLPRAGRADHGRRVDLAATRSASVPAACSTTSSPLHSAEHPA